MRALWEFAARLCWRRDSVHWNLRRKEDGTDGVFYDGALGQRCREMPRHNTSGTFRTLIRYENGTFYDRSSENNS